MPKTLPQTASETLAKTTDHIQRLTHLREKLASAKLDGFIIPRADRYISKYPADHDERLHFLSGFTGSAGNIVVLQDKAIVMTDSRYAITIKQEVDASAFETDSTSKITPASWLTKNAAKNAQIAFDPALHTCLEIESLEKALTPANISLIPLTENPVDSIWNDQPARPMTAAFIHDEKYAGKSSDQKRKAVALELKKEACDHFIMASTEALCWILNIRGHDTPYSPTVQCSALFDAENASMRLYIDINKITDDVKKHLGNSITLHDEHQFESDLAQLGATGEVIGYCPDRTPYAYKKILDAAQSKIKECANPAALMKAKKNSVEQNNLRIAQKRDSLAWIKFLHWVDTNLPQDQITEMDASDKLDEFRGQDPAFVGHGYPPIAGWAKNGADIHYHSTHRGAAITTDNMLLIDSGAQSLDGQTDITRAILVGTPTDEMIERYSLVLKGHINLAQAIFPKGTTGTQIDILARKALWERGLNYPHGTGHGIGFYMDVHEGPCNISPRSTCPLEEGMYLSNEPGYYKEGHYGIRLENEVLVQPLTLKSNKGEHEMLHFETITFVPFDTRLIDPNVMNADEISWLNRYHESIYTLYENQLDEAVKIWLRNATLPIA